MKVLGIRFCTVTSQAPELARFLAGPLGLPLHQAFSLPADGEAGAFAGAVFPAGDSSWIEAWEEAPGMPAGIMLQVVVDDADAWAAGARERGLEPHGPTDAHGERIYYVQAPSKLPIAVLSKSPGGA